MNQQMHSLCVYTIVFHVNTNIVHLLANYYRLVALNARSE